MTPRSKLFRAVVLAGIGVASATVVACSAHHSASPASRPSATGSAATTAAARTTPVPAPGGGNIHQTVTAPPLKTNAPVSLAEPAVFGGGMSARVVQQHVIQAEARLPGEMAGPAASVTIRMINDSSKAVSLAAVVVNEYDANGTPLVMTTSISTPLHGMLAAHGSAEGTYVFELPNSYVNPLRLTVGYSTAAPVVVFIGPVR
jgi:hypothetical protein